jgi:dolichyl-phosphate beta-glucosyltransferase
MVPYVSIVIPAYNEANRLPPTLEQLAKFCEQASWTVEVLIVIERSTDGTLEIARECAAQQAQSRAVFKVIDNGPQHGKGHAVRSGMLQASGELIVYMDVDLSVPLSTLPTFVHLFEEHPETAVLVGNRQHALSQITRAQGWVRRSMGQTFNRILGFLGIAKLRDTQCGFKAFRREAAREIFARQKVEGFAFDVEVLLLAERLGYQVIDVPVEWINSPESKVHIVRDSLRMLIDAVRIRRSLKGIPAGYPRK